MATTLRPGCEPFKDQEDEWQARWTWTFGRQEWVEWRADAEGSAGKDVHEEFGRTGASGGAFAV